jgi:hypothetical protein
MVLQGAIVCGFGPYFSTLAVSAYGFGDRGFAVLLVLSTAVSVTASVAAGIRADQTAERQKVTLAAVLSLGLGFLLMTRVPGPWVFAVTAAVLLPLGSVTFGQVFGLARMAATGGGSAGCLTGCPRVDSFPCVNDFNELPKFVQEFFTLGPLHQDSVPTGHFVWPERKVVCNSSSSPARVGRGQRGLDDLATGRGGPLVDDRRMKAAQAVEVVAKAAPRDAQRLGQGLGLTLPWPWGFNRVGSQANGVLPTFVVADVEAAHGQAVAMAAEVVEPPRDMPYGQRRLLLRDPAGVLVDVSAPIRQA